MSDSKSSSRTGSKSNLNESSLPLLETNEESVAEGKGGTPEKECIELTHDEKDDSSPEKKDDDKAAKQEKKSKKSIKACKPPTLQQLTNDLDLSQRDSEHINDFINVDFSHVLAEPTSTHGFDPFWRLSALAFRGTHRWLYRVLAALVALPLSVAWGVVFAIISLLAVWLVTPVLKIVHLVLSVIRQLIEGITKTFVEPLYRAFGACFSSVGIVHQKHVV